MEKMFEKALREKVRFESGKGMFTVEDLWTLSLTSLDAIAKGLSKQIKEASEESFIKPRSTSNKSLELKFEIVKYIIVTLMDEEEKKRQKATKAAELSTLRELLANKKMQEMASLSSEEIEKRIAELQS